MLFHHRKCVSFCAKIEASKVIRLVSEFFFFSQISTFE